MRENRHADTIATLGQRGWLSRMPADFRDAILSRCVAMHCNAGDPVYFVGDEAGGMFGVVSGTVEIASGFGNPDAYIVHLAQSGFWVGEGSVLADVPRFITVRARTSATLAFISRASLQAVVTANPAYWRCLGMLSVEHNNLSTSTAVDLMIRDIEHRCIAVLLRVSGSRLRRPDNPVDPVAVVTQEELAAMANLSRNAVGEVLRKLADLDMIELGYRTIHIKDAEALRLIVESG